MKKTIALLQLLHYCNSFLGGQLLHIAIFNSFFSHYCYCYCNSSDGYCQCLGFELLFFQILAPVLLISGSKGLNFRLFQGYSKFSISGKLGFGFDTTLFFTLRQCLSTIDRRCHATNWFYLKNRSKRLYESAILA